MRLVKQTTEIKNNKIVQNTFFDNCTVSELIILASKLQKSGFKKVKK